MPLKKAAHSPSCNRSVRDEQKTNVEELKPAMQDGWFLNSTDQNSNPGGIPPGQYLDIMSLIYHYQNRMV
jgi:hypothetical protein